MNTQTREWLHIGNIRRLGYTWASLEDAMLDRDPFQNTLPCWEHRSATEYAIRAYQDREQREGYGGWTCGQPKMT